MGILSGLWDFINGIVSFVQSLISLIGMFVSGLINLVTMIPQYMAFTTTAIAYLPSVLVVFATAAISISVVYLIIGR